MYPVRATNEAEVTRKVGAAVDKLRERNGPAAFREVYELACNGIDQADVLTAAEQILGERGLSGLKPHTEGIIDKAYGKLREDDFVAGQVERARKALGYTDHDAALEEVEDAHHQLGKRDKFYRRQLLEVKAMLDGLEKEIKLLDEKP